MGLLACLVNAIRAEMDQRRRILRAMCLQLRVGAAGERTAEVCEPAGSLNLSRVAKPIKDEI